MANEKFTGHLLHTLGLYQDVIDAITGNVTTETQQYEFEVLNAAVLLSCKNMLPVLKSVKMWIEVLRDEGISVGANGGLIVTASLWNRDQDAIPEERDPGIFSYELFGEATIEVWDGDSAATLSIQTKKVDLQRNYGVDGVMLRPRISMEFTIRNVSGASIAADSYRVHIEPVIDFVPVTEAEFNNYLQELFLFNAIVND